MYNRDSYRHFIAEHDSKFMVHPIKAYLVS
jgi:hypothetical protein